MNGNAGKPKKGPGLNAAQIVGLLLLLVIAAAIYLAVVR